MFKGLISLLTTVMIGRFMGQSAAAMGMMGVSSAMLRKISVLLALFALGTLLLFGGFLTVLVDLILASYTLGQVTLTPLSWVGAGLMVLAALTYSITFSERFWRPVARPVVQPAPLS